MTPIRLKNWPLFIALLASPIATVTGQVIIIQPQPVPPIRHPHPPRPIPRPPRPLPPQRNMQLDVKTHAINTTIQDGVAQTHIEQVFFNPHTRVVEGTYIFPLDDDIALDRFSMFVNGSEIEGKLLGVDEARRQYESIVAKMRDPALLEYLGTRMFRARIFPINPKSEVRIKLSYTQMLKAEDGLVRYRYPLGTDRSLSKPIEIVAISLVIESSTPIKSVFSPSHKLALNRPSDRRATASFEGKNIIPDRNFELYYTLSEKEFGLTVLTHRPHGEDGFFLARIAPPIKSDANDVLPKDMTFVIDTSGSMSGQKIEQARRALKFCLDHLKPKDSFNIVPFSHEPIPFRDSLVAATPENLKAAHAFVDGLSATGGTNINDALMVAIGNVGHRETDRPHQIVFLTDGQPTVGVTQPEEILKNIANRNDGRLRLYVFGVGYDVNTQLLDLLAEQNRGTRDYVEPDEDLELKLSSFYRKVSEPVLASLALTMNDLGVYDMYPPKLGDLFAGSELLVVGRYKGQGAKAIELTGTRRGKLERFIDEANFPSESETHAFLASLWATRKVGYLLDEIRLHGENKELKDTIVKLATAYGIITPYTAYLVTEPGSVAMREGRRDNMLFEAISAMPRREAEKMARDVSVALAPASDGRMAGGVSNQAPRLRVRASKGIMALKNENASVAPPDASTLLGSGTKKHDDASPRVVRVEGRTFYLIEDRWMDAAYKKDMKTTKVESFSDEYFGLLRKHAELAKCFALGDRVVVVLDGTAYETAPPASDD